MGLTADGKQQKQMLKFNDRSIELLQYEDQRERKLEKVNVELMTCGATSNSLNIIGVSEREREGKWGRNTFEEMRVTYIW